MSIKFCLVVDKKERNGIMRKIMTLVVVVIFMTSLIGTTVNAEEERTAAEICKSAKSWEEYKQLFEDFQPDREDQLGRVLKKLPADIENLSTFKMGFSYGGIKDEKVDEFAEAISYATYLYNNSETAHIRFSSVEKKDLEGPYSQVDAIIEDNPLTHIGNVVICADIPYYSSIDEYLSNKKPHYYSGRIICYTCGVSYWNPDMTLGKTEYIPYDEIAGLKDEKKPQINRDFDGEIIILLCTTDAILGWADLEGLYQYEDANGNMEFYNPYFITYK